MNIDYILQNHGIGTGKKSKDIVPPPPCTGFVATSGNAQVVLSWTNPVDTDFVGVKILRQTGIYPTSPTDGTIVYSGANTSYTDTTVTNGTTYYYRIFTFDYDNNFNTTASGQEATATPMAYTIYGVKIDTTNSNPETAVTYIENSIGFTKATGNNGSFSYGSWADKFPFNLIKPCVFKTGGLVDFYLNPNDYTKKSDNSIWSIQSNSIVMIEFPKIYWKFETIGTYIYIRYSDIQVDSSYKCLAHMRGTTEKDKCYIGAYLGRIATALYSTSGLPVAASQTIGAFRTLAQANGTGYDQIGYFQLLMLQVLYAVMFKNLDSQTALGRGYVDANASAINTGGTNAKGMYYGETTGKLQMKCFGIEDLWGNLYSYVDGIYSDANRNILIGTQSFNDTGTGYTSYGQGATVDLNNPLKYVQGGTETGFIAKDVSGSTSTYYCDSSALKASSMAMFGGYYAGGNNEGIFRLFIGNAVASAGTSVCARLMYL